MTIFVPHVCTVANHEDRGRDQDHTFGHRVGPRVGCEDKGRGRGLQYPRPLWRQPIYRSLGLPALSWPVGSFPPPGLVLFAQDRVPGPVQQALVFLPLPLRLPSTLSS